MNYKEVLDKIRITQNIFTNDFTLSIVKNTKGGLVENVASRNMTEQEIKCYLCAFIDYFKDKGINTLIKGNTEYKFEIVDTTKEQDK